MILHNNTHFFKRSCLKLGLYWKYMFGRKTFNYIYYNKRVQPQSAVLTILTLTSNQVFVDYRMNKYNRATYFYRRRTGITCVFLLIKKSN